MANSVDPDQTAPIGAVCSGSTLFASILNIIYYKHKGIKWERAHRAIYNL